MIFGLGVIEESTFLPHPCKMRLSNSPYKVELSSAKTEVHYRSVERALIFSLF